MVLHLRIVFLAALTLAANASNLSLGAQSVSSQSSAQQETNPSPPQKSSYKYAERDWDALTSELRTDKSPSDAHIYSFVMAMLEGVSDSAVQSPEDAVLAGVSVCSAGFFDIYDIDSTSLIASIDVNGRHFCNNVEVIHRDANGLTIQEIDVWEVDDVKDIVRDLGKNGKDLLVVPAAYSEYDGAKCLATWSRVYAVQSGALVDRSNSFKEYYKERLDKLLGKDMQRAKARDENDGGDSVICIQMEIDKIERFLGMSQNAGEDRAIEWVMSTDRSLRLKGIVALADIGDKRSVTTLQQFTQDPDAIVADAAKRGQHSTLKE